MQSKYEYEFQLLHERTVQFDRRTCKFLNFSHHLRNITVRVCPAIISTYTKLEQFVYCLLEQRAPVNHHNICILLQKDHDRLKFSSIHSFIHSFVIFVNIFLLSALSYFSVSTITSHYV